MTDMIPGHHRLEHTDLEIVFNRRGDDLVLRVNKGPVQVFRALLINACKKMTEDQLTNYNPLSPDLVFKIGDMEEALQRFVRAVGNA